MRKYSELLTIPGTLFLLWVWNLFAEHAGLFTFGWEKVGKVFAAFVIYLIALGFVRITHLLVWPLLYKYFDPSFNQNRRWKLLSEKEKFIYSFWLHLSLLLLFGLILSAL